MCYGCWQEYGGQIIDTPEVRKAAKAVTALYEEHCTGGNLHVVVDDYNVGDYSLARCQEDCDLSVVEKAAYDALQPLNEEERASALALQDGYWSPK